MPQSGGSPDGISHGKTSAYSCKTLPTIGGSDCCILCSEIKASLHLKAYETVVEASNSLISDLELSKLRNQVVSSLV
jgi:hypothetical protein